VLGYLSYVGLNHHGSACTEVIETHVHMLHSDASTVGVVAGHKAVTDT